MKAIMISIKPRHLVNILNGKKTIEIRKNKALASAIEKLIQEEGCSTIYVYCSKDKKNLLHKNCINIYWVEDKDFQNKNKKLGIETQPYLNGKVVCSFKCYKVEGIFKTSPLHYGTETIYKINEKCCLTDGQIHDYLKSEIGYAIHISDLNIFDKPKRLSEFEKVGSYSNPTIKCKKKEQGGCNYGRSPFTGKWVGCEKARLTKAPQNMVYVEIPNDN